MIFSAVVEDGWLFFRVDDAFYSGGKKVGLLVTFKVVVKEGLVVIFLLLFFFFFFCVLVEEGLVTFKLVRTHTHTQKKRGGGLMTYTEDVKKKTKKKERSVVTLRLVIIERGVVMFWERVVVDPLQLPAVTAICTAFARKSEHALMQ